MSKLTENLTKKVLTAADLYSQATQDRPAKVILELTNARTRIVIAEQLTELNRQLALIAKKLGAPTKTAETRTAPNKPARKAPTKKVG